MNFQATGEEVDMPKSWVPIDEAVKLVLSGKIMSPSAVVGIMAYQLSKQATATGK
jgi:ADP-ribose pyrophosphatase